MTDNRKYDIVFVTNMPSFYKVKLWNELNRRVRVFAIFVDAIQKDRNLDFVSEKPEFDFEVLSSSGALGKCWQLYRLIHSIKYDRLIVGGWESVPSILSYFISPRKKNAVFCESSIYEIDRSILKDSIKRLILGRTVVAYPSGKSQAEVLRLFGYKGRVVFTGGCGILNYVEQLPFDERSSVSKFLYVGRLADVKNLRMLIEAFNELEGLHLDIIGFGELETELRSMAGSNVSFLGAVKNSELPSYYRDHDVFILPSKVEPWGLVVEEALNNGVPVIVSDRVGCKDDLVSSAVGIVFNHDDKKSLKASILSMTDLDRYNEFRRNISQMNFIERSGKQVEAYLK